MSGAEQAARETRSSRPVQALARLGLGGRGLVWLVLALLAGRLVLGRGAQADQEGAFRTLRDAPAGTPLLVVLALGFAGYAAWCLLTAAVGHRSEDDGERRRHRLVALGKGAVYAALCFSTVRFLAAGSSGGGSPESRTAGLLGEPPGRVLVGFVGLVVVGIGVGLAARGVVAKHAERLEGYRVPDRLHRPAVVVGAVGIVGRGVVLALVGAFFVQASLTADPDDAKGLDAALQTVAEQPYGRGLLAVAVVALVGYALWSFVEAAFGDLQP